MKDSSGRRLFAESEQGSAPFNLRNDSCKRAAALPVGAASAMRSGRSSASSSNSASNITTVRVLPVPGPPEMTQNRRRSAVKAATFCQFVSP